MEKETLFIVTFVHRSKEAIMWIKKTLWIMLSVTCLCGTLQAQTDTVEQKSPITPEEQFVRAIRTTGAVYSNLQRYFVDTIDLEKINAIALNKMLELLDPYTQYMTKSEVQSFSESTTGNYGGVGAIISQRPDTTVIFNEPFEGQPAALAGIKAGDRILSIDNKNFTHAFTPEVSKALRGPEGSMIHVEVMRKGVKEPLSFNFKRKEVYISPVAYAGMIDDGIALIRLSSFMQDAGTEFRKTFTDLLNKEHPKAFILDLRGNGGGVLQSSVELVSMFVPRGTAVVSVKGRKGAENISDAVYKTTSNPVAPDIPMVVLIDEETASSSEIVAGAFQDLDRAVIMGTRSYGKGLVQSTIRMPDDAMLKLTTAHYYTPSGRSIQKVQYDHLGKSDSILTQADSLGAPYFTLAGRKVYSSGGITPDIPLVADSLQAFVGYLAADTLVFDWIVQYEREATRPIVPGSFSLTEEEYDSFGKMLAERAYNYKPYSMYVLDMLEKVLTSEGSIEFNKEALSAFRKRITPDIKTELERNKKDVKEYIEAQIVLRRAYRKGFYAHMLPQDTQIKAAVALLNNPNKMSAILSK